MTINKIGILLCNIGTPEAPTPAAVRTYLKEFLSDPRVVQLPKILWQPILRSVILPFRPKKSAELYEKIWTPAGSPQLVNMQELAEKLETVGSNYCVRVGMRYGNPSIQTALDDMRAEGVTQLLCLPLFPQYSATTTASAQDSIALALKNWPTVKLMPHAQDYATTKSYINAICDSIRQFQSVHGKKYLLFSYHGIPEKYIKAGDVYQARCVATTEFVAAELGLDPDAYSLAYQSRLGTTKWLTPYTDKILAELPQQNIKDIHVICPGFAVDCLETLEEIAIRGKEQFLHAGGENFAYIPALNASDLQLQNLIAIIQQELAKGSLHML